MNRFATFWISTLFWATPTTADTIISAQLYRSIDFDDQFAGYFLPYPQPDGNFRECGEQDGEIIYRTVTLDEVEEAIGTCPKHSDVYAFVTYSYKDFSALAPGMELTNVTDSTAYGTIQEVFLKGNGEFGGIVVKTSEGGDLTYLDAGILNTWSAESGPLFSTILDKNKIAAIPKEVISSGEWQGYVFDTYGVNGLSTSLESGAISANGTISIPGLSNAPLR
ncbi:hypothetical protein [Actibacterium pelagium]|uniref:Uncharacterized protein n=1 Tax=Actibacterium pelagium TaxID=2029103 RepID=A0A917ACV0_9RHOB|nr:hypothetical protein [Actibacterium pelagium]GGE38954.1 hypothetical protein GCM10011517_03390 [Actibacterium pelagium]